MRLIIAIAAGAALLAACSPATHDTADAPEADAAAAAPQGASQLAAAAGTNCEAPAPTAVAVTGEMTREGQLALLAHPDPKLAANKRLVWDMWRTLLNGYHIDRAGEFIHPDYIQHNPMANTGLAGMQGFFRSLGLPPRHDAALLAVLDAGPFPARYAVHSFDHRITARLASRRAGLSLGALLSARIADSVGILRAAGATTLWQEWTMIDQELVEAVHGAGGRVIAWTVNDRAGAVRLGQMGVDGLCGNFPDRLVVAT
jgi:hypothetical protein